MRHQTHADASSSRTLPDMAYLQRTTFAQALMERAWMTEKEAKKLLQDITGYADGTVIPSEILKRVCAVNMYILASLTSPCPSGVHWHFCYDA